jgi:hypothetical protein
MLKSLFKFGLGLSVTSFVGLFVIADEQRKAQEEISARISQASGAPSAKLKQ